MGQKPKSEANFQPRPINVARDKANGSPPLNGVPTRLQRLKRALRLSIAVVVLAGLAAAVGACGGDDDDASRGGPGGTSGIVLVGGSGGGNAGDTASSAGDTATSGEAGKPTIAGGAAGGEPAIGGGSTGGTSASGSSSGGNNGLYLPCASQADCKQYGGGKICCSTSSMRFCTKQSACTGDVLP